MTATKDDGTVEAPAPALVVTPELLRACAPAAPPDGCKRWAPHLDSAARGREINTPIRLAWWLAHGLFETNQLRDIVEAETPQCNRYDGGARYRGRGMPHLTHLYNYRLYGEALGLDLVGRPELAAEPEHSARIYALFWVNMGGNALIDAGRFEGSSAAIHRGDPDKPILGTTYHGIRESFANRGFNYLRRPESPAPALV